MKRLNNKGFTLIEVTVSFLFVFSLAFEMYSLLYNYKVKQNEVSARNQMIAYSEEVTLAIQNDIQEKVLKNIDYCKSGSSIIDKCIELSFMDNTKKNLSINKETFCYSDGKYTKGESCEDGNLVEASYIKYGKTEYRAIDQLLLTYENDYLLYHSTIADKFTNDSVNLYRINIPITHNDIEGDYGIHIVAKGFNYQLTTSINVVGLLGSPYTSSSNTLTDTYVSGISSPDVEVKINNKDFKVECVAKNDSDVSKVNINQVSNQLIKIRMVDEGYDRIPITCRLFSSTGNIEELKRKEFHVGNGWYSTGVKPYADDPMGYYNYYIKGEQITGWKKLKWYNSKFGLTEKTYYFNPLNNNYNEVDRLKVGSYYYMFNGKIQRNNALPNGARRENETIDGNYYDAGGKCHVGNASGAYCTK